MSVRTAPRHRMRIGLRAAVGGVRPRVIALQARSGASRSGGEGRHVQKATVPVPRRASGPRVPGQPVPDRTVGYPQLDLVRWRQRTVDGPLRPVSGAAVRGCQHHDGTHLVRITPGGRLLCGHGRSPCRWRHDCWSTAGDLERCHRRYPRRCDGRNSRSTAAEVRRQRPTGPGARRVAGQADQGENNAGSDPAPGPRSSRRRSPRHRWQRRRTTCGTLR
jgi:hypothetical protein